MNKVMAKVNLSFATTLMSVLALASCGQAPSFSDASSIGGLAGSGSKNGGGESTSAGGGEASGSVDPNNPDGTSGSGDPGTPGEGGGGDITYTIPGADPDDVPALQRCLASWKNLPFAPAITDYKRIYAAVSVGSNAVVIDDTAQTSAPQLILVSASVNVGGSPIYNLRNQNGFYCMKVGVNVNTNLTVNLACNARLADSKLQVGVNSSGTANAGIGVNVGSDVTVQDVDQNGQTTCHQ